jgi:hypothetical protein
MITQWRAPPSEPAKSAFLRPRTSVARSEENVAAAEIRLWTDEVMTQAG